MYYAIMYQGLIPQELQKPNENRLCMIIQESGLDNRHELELSGLYALKFDTEEDLMAFLGIAAQASTQVDDAYERSLGVIFDSINGWAENMPNILIGSELVADKECIGGSNALLGNLIEYGLWLRQSMSKAEVEKLLGDFDGHLPISGNDYYDIE